MAKLLKPNKIPEIPGPGTYNDLNLDLIKNSMPKYSIKRPSTSLNKKPKPKIVIPGPGSYLKAECDYINKSVTTTFIKDTRFRKQKYTYESTPGFYNIPSDLSVSTNPKIQILNPHTSKAKVVNYKSVPGPGSYFERPADPYSTKYSIGLKRPMSAVGLNLPGPGHYFSAIQYRPSSSQIS